MTTENNTPTPREAALIDCARWLVYAYRAGELGGGSIDWTYIDNAYEQALNALSHDEVAVVWGKAALDMGIDDDDNSEEE